ncbi:MAG TPA: ankyrin repeat domain-containing protein, partial [Hyphomicrobiales bacterium]|nr:ankyrin repeat domain-containing protein [Hyphomicrobiales bacterium]
MRNVALRTLTSWLLCTALAAPPAALAQDASLADLIQRGDPAVAEMLRVGMDVNQRQADGTSALHWAVYRNDVALVQQLLSREADPNAKNLFGSTPLMEAVKIANADTVALLL